ncbi:MAG TPA: tetratricopeptide repeat protein [Alphaproteobacteria bacterium]|nr:tetratricopeptide repeat protein [Alphaproteobacteria bacterium]
MADGLPERRLATILAADVVGYSRLMSADEEGTFNTVQALMRDVLGPAIARHRGRIVKTTGDGILAEFSSPVEAVRCAGTIQGHLSAASAELPDRRIRLRIGINLGDVIAEAGDVFGEGVNVAARLEALAEPDTIFISGSVYDHVRGKIPYRADELGLRRLKNIADPVRVYRLVAGTETARPMSSPARASSGEPSVAVLPFANASGDAGQEYFSDGITEDIITELSRFSNLAVRPRHVTFGLKGGEASLAALGETVKADYVLEGSVRKAGPRIRVTAQLSDTRTGRQIWAERYDRDLTDVFAVQDELARSIVAALGVKVEEGERLRGLEKAPESMEAYDYYLHGLHFQRRDLLRARRMFEAAIERAPGLARAYVGLAWNHLIEFKWVRETADPAQLDAAHRTAITALALNPADAEAHWLIGAIHLWRRESAAAISAYERARQLNPNHPDLLAEMVDALTYAGRSVEAIAIGERALALNPSHPQWYLWNLAAAYYLTGRYEEALDRLNRMTEPGPAYRLIAATHAQLGHYDEAHLAAQRLLRFDPEFSISRFAAATPYVVDADRQHYIDGLRKAGLPE